MGLFRVSALGVLVIRVPQTNVDMLRPYEIPYLGATTVAGIGPEQWASGDDTSISENKSAFQGEQDREGSEL